MSDTIRGLLVRASGPAELVTIPSDWRELNAIIGASWGQVVRTPIDGVVMWVDEEGRLARKTDNQLLSYRLYPGLICGDAFLVAEVKHPEPDTASLTDAQVEQLHAWIPFARLETTS